MSKQKKNKTRLDVTKSVKTGENEEINVSEPLHSSAEGVNNNAQLDEEPVVGTSKSLINSIKKRKKEKLSSGESSPERELKRKEKKTKVSMRGISPPKKRTKTLSGCMVYTSDEENSDEDYVRVEVNKRDREENSYGETSEDSSDDEAVTDGSFDTSDSDPDVEKIDRYKSYRSSRETSEADWSSDEPSTSSRRNNKRHKTKEVFSESEFETTDSEPDQIAKKKSDKRDMKLMKKDPKVRRLLDVMAREQFERDKEARKKRKQQRKEKEWA